MDAFIIPMKTVKISLVILIQSGCPENECIGVLPVNEGEKFHFVSLEYRAGFSTVILRKFLFAHITNIFDLEIVRWFQGKRDEHEFGRLSDLRSESNSQIALYTRTKKNFDII